MSTLDAGASFLARRQRVIYSLFRAASRLGVRLGIPLDQMVELLKMAYFSEARDEQGLELEPISQLFGKSLRTVSSLHRRYRGDFFAPEREVQFRRALADRIARAGGTPDDLARAFPDHGRGELEIALTDLLREGRIVWLDGVLRRNPADHDFFDATDSNAGIDGLNRQLDIVAETVWQRMLQESARPDAVARSYVFASEQDDFDRLIKELLDKLRHDCIAADASARAHGTDNRRAITLATATLEEG